MLNSYRDIQGWHFMLGIWEFYSENYTNIKKQLPVLPDQGKQAVGSSRFIGGTLETSAKAGSEMTLLAAEISLRRSSIAAATGFSFSGSVASSPTTSPGLSAVSPGVAMLNCVFINGEAARSN